MNRLAVKLTFILIIIISISSCMQPRYISQSTKIDIPYQDIPTISEPYILQPYDYLYVQIRTTNKDVNELFESISTQLMPTQNDYYFFLTGYLINDSGYVSIPLIGTIKASGKTLEEVRRVIEDSIHKNISDAVINVRLTSFNIYFLGELNHPGEIKLYKERVSILEAISKAGGITKGGDRRNIYIIRRQDSVFHIFKLDLTNKNILSNKNIYLHPNDIIYVPMRKMYNLRLALSDYFTLLTFITSTITTVVLILNLRNGQ